MKELLEGRVDAFIGNKLTGIYILQKLKQLNKVKIAGDPLNLTEYCSVTLKGNTKVLNLLNKGIKDIKKNGTYERIYRKWFGQNLFDNGFMTKELFLSISVVCSFIIGILVLIFLWNRSLKKLVVIKTRELAKANNELYINQEKLEQSNRLQGKILENILDGIIAFDQRGKVLGANFAAKELLKIDIESELSFEDLNFDDYLISEGYEQALHGEIWRRDLLWDKGSGEILNIDCNISPIKGPGGEVEGVILVLHNYTESMLLDEAREFDKLKTEFFANISHELRTPLNLIFGIAQLLEMYKDDDNELALKNMVEKSTLVIRQNINRLTRLINNIIDITKADTGFLELQLNNYNIVSVIEGVTMSIVDYCNNKGISLQFDTDIEEKIIACDAEKIERILLNLLSNSIKFTENSGSIFVRVIDGEEFVTVSVLDSGIGIPNDKQEFIFERFRQVDKSISRRNEGSGIGLSLVKSLVEMHGGTINVVSKYGFGSEFIIKLPVTKLPSDPIEYIIDSFSTEKIKIEFSDIL
jgi:two-component system phosphate regulon sensor histidine kinase PhoR